MCYFLAIVRYLSYSTLFLSTLNTVAAQERTVVTDQWWPSEWGEDDQRGAVNRITTAKVLEAAKLIASGKIYELGRNYESGMPLWGNRHYSLTIVGSPTGGPLGVNHVVWHDEMLSAQIGQIGTQFDGLGHVGTRIQGTDYFYNGFKREDFGRGDGLAKLGVEHVGVFFTRGVLLDIAGLKGVERLEPGYVITPTDIQASLDSIETTIHPGDAVFLRTGHGSLWMVDNRKFNESEPGLGVEAARWLIDKQVVLVAADNWGIEAFPAPDPERVFEVHQWLLTRSGIYILENVYLDELAKDRVTDFAFIFSPLKLKGATGSPGNPIAVK